MDIQENPIKTDFERQSFQGFRNWWDGVHDSMKCPTYKAWSIWQQAQKMAVPEGFVLLSHEDIARLMNTIDFLGVKALGDEYISFSEIHKIVEEWQEQNKAMIEAQEQTDISKFDGYVPMQSRSKEPTHD